MTCKHRLSNPRVAGSIPAAPTSPASLAESTPNSASKDTQHTPAPWEVKYGRNGFRKQGESNITSIGPLFADHDHWDGLCLPISDEDARLIAAAPELLKVLEVLSEREISDDDRRMIDSAIRKAKGEL